MTSNSECPNCHQSLPPDAPGGLCASCLLAAALSEPDRGQVETLPRQDGFQAPSPEVLTQVIPGIAVTELLGHGGMGAVYRGQQVNLDRPVALKILAPRLSNDPGFSERFAREAKTLARLNHPNIVTIYDFGTAGDYCYLVMELIEGVNLRDAILSGGITPSQALAIIPRVCEALQYAHNQGVVHRDIKPENILIGMNDEVKIADFGLAKMLNQAGNSFTLTATQQILGTRNYMAPEQIEKPSTVDHRADIYSLGVVFYELLTGELPLGRFSLPSEKAAVSGALDDVVLRTLEKEPGRRFQQASDVKSAVESLDWQRESPLEPVNGIPSREPVAEKPPVAAAAHRPSPGSGATRPGRKPSLPFHNDQIHGGLSQLHGLAQLNEHSLDIEFRIHNLGVAKSAKRRVSIPYDELVDTLLTRGVFSSTLEIQAGSLDAFDKIPGSVQGRLKMVLDKKHDLLGSDFHRELDNRISLLRADESTGRPATTESSLAHVPFKIDHVHGGFSEAYGIARVTQEHIIVEFEIKDAFGVVKSAPRAAMISFDDIISIHFRQGIWRDKIELQTNSLDGVAVIPNSEQGKFRILTSKRDRELATQWTTRARNLAGLPADIDAPARKPDRESARRAALKKRLFFPRLLLLLVPLVNLAFLVRSGVGLLDKIPNLDFDLESWRELADSFSLFYGIAIVNSVTMIFVTLATLWMLRHGKYYPVVIAALVLLALPVHPGFFVALPAACWILGILFQPENRQTFTNASP